MFRDSVLVLVWSLDGVYLVFGFRLVLWCYIVVASFGFFRLVVAVSFLGLLNIFVEDRSLGGSTMRSTINDPCH